MGDFCLVLFKKITDNPMPRAGKTIRANGVFMSTNVALVIIAFSNGKIHKPTKTFSTTRTKNGVTVIIPFIFPPYYFPIIILYSPQKSLRKTFFNDKFQKAHAKLLNIFNNEPKQQIENIPPSTDRHGKVSQKAAYTEDKRRNVHRLFLIPNNQQ